MSVCECVYVWMLTRVEQIATAAHRDLQSCVHVPTDEMWSETKNHIDLLYGVFRSS